METVPSLVAVEKDGEYWKKEAWLLNHQEKY